MARCFSEYKGFSDFIPSHLSRTSLLRPRAELSTIVKVIVVDGPAEPPRFGPEYGVTVSVWIPGDNSAGVYHPFSSPASV